MTDDPDNAELPPYTPIERTDTLVRCNRCGSVVDGQVVGLVQHDVFHKKLDQPVRDPRLNAMA